MKSLRFIIIFFLIFSNITFSQSVKELEAKLKNAKSSHERSKLYLEIGTAYYNDGDFTNALSYFFRALNDTKTNERHFIGVAYHGIGSVYMETGNFKDALSYLKNAQRLFSELNDQKSIGRVLLTIGNLYYMQEEDSLSELFYHKSLDISQSVNDSVNMIDGYRNLGALYFESGNRSDTMKGAEFIKRTLEYIRPNDTTSRFLSYLGLAELYSYTGYLYEAKTYLDHCTTLLPHVKALHILDDYYFCLHHYHKTKGNFEQALSAYSKYKTYQDSILNIVNNTQLSELNIKYQTEQKEKKIELLKAQKETQRLILIIVALTVSLLVILSYFLFIRYKRRQQRKKEQELQSQKEAERIRIARDMHDEIGAGLTRIVMRSEQAKQLLQSDKELKSGIMESLTKMTSEARELSRNIGEIIWALNPKNDMLDTLFAYIRSYAYDYLEQANISCTINFPDFIPNVTFSPELRRNVFLIVKESLNNIVKHSGATEAELTLILSEKEFTLIIKDNGKGIIIDTTKESGNGLGNMKKRTEEIGGTFTLKNDQGTSVIAENIPFTKNPTKV